jgi:serine/threonine protein kinase
VEPLNRKVGQFEILRKLGRGGFADVYLAHDAKRNEVVALKLIEHSNDADTQESIVAEERGARLQQALADRDRHVVQIFEWGNLDNYFFVSMEYIAGEDLAELVHRAPISATEAARIASEICLTLDSAHTLQVTIDGRQFQGVVHGDIKPRNIRIDPEHRVRVIDFGIAKALSLSRRLTRNEFGSAAYASPERLESYDVNVQSDLWSVGVLLYEMVSGRQPYSADSAEKLEHLIRSRVPPPPLPESCPEPMRRIIAKALHPDPARRYNSAHDLRIDLLSFQSGGLVQAMTETDNDATRRSAPRTSGGDETRRTVRPAPPRPPSAASSGRPKRRRRAPFVLGFFFIATAFFVYLFASWYLTWTHGRDLERQINVENLADPDQVWASWQKVAGSNPGSILLYSPRHAVRRELQQTAERVIETYRNNDAQPVYEKEWDRARRSLAHALELDPGNDKIRGELRLCEGHIARINGTSHHNVNLFNDAIAKFHEAAQLLRNSPDPYLGLSRVYIYGLKDVQKADDAMHDAEKRGYKLGNREKTQLADGYTDRADRLFADSHKLGGLPQEKDMLNKCVDDYQRAMELYQGLIPYAHASENVLRVQGKIDRVNERIAQIGANL